jgi:two-component system nitrogen regulation sensor histidine kinase NtrY
MRPGAKHVTLHLYRLGGDAVLAVTDDGVGLPEQDRARLTEPYVTHKPKGTGLGLAIVRKIMEDHGGRLDLEQAPDGPGAVVSLVLPALETAAVDTVAETAAADNMAYRMTTPGGFAAE